MAELQERYRPWAEREGLVGVGCLPMNDARRAVTRSLATMDLAGRVFETVVGLLGERGWLDPAGGEAQRILHVRDRELADWLVCRSLLVLSFVPTSVVVAQCTVADALLPAEAPDGWKPGDPPYWEKQPEPRIFPRGPSMRPGELTIAEGDAYLTTTFDDRGLYKESCESGGDTFLFGRHGSTAPYTIDPLARPPTPRPLGLLCRADLDPKGHEPGTFAKMVAELDPWSRAPGRARVPVPLPGGVGGAWSRGLGGLRRALWSGRVLDDARVLVVDAFDGSAVVSGAGLDEVLARWEAELFRAKPRPPRPVEPTPRKPSPAPGEPETFKDEEGRTVGFSTGTITVTAGGGASIEWPAAVPRNIPAVMVELPPLPEVPLALAAAGFSKWVRLVGQHGLVSLALCRREEQGFTLVGQGIVDLVDPTTIEAELDAADAQERAFHAATPELPAPWDQDFAASALVSYGLVDAVGRQRAPARVRGGQWSGGFDAGSLDGDQLEWVVCRQRRLR